MSILVQPHTKVLVQGITGEFGARHARLSPGVAEAMASRCVARSASAARSPAARWRCSMPKSSRASRSPIGVSVPITSPAPALEKAAPRLSARVAVEELLRRLLTP